MPPFKCLLCALAFASISIVAGGQIQNQAAPQSATELDADDTIPKPEELAKLLVPKVGLISPNQVKYELSPDGRQLTFTYEVDLANVSLRQIAEIDVVLVFRQSSTGKEIFRSKEVPFKSFKSLRIPNVGACEGFTTLGALLVGKYTVPAEIWTTDTHQVLGVTRVVPKPDESDLHDIGNLIAFVTTHHTSEVIAALAKDPTVIQASNSEGVTATMVAAAVGSPQLIKYMVSHGGDLHSKAKTGHDAMVFAASGDNPKNLEYVKSQGFDVNGHEPDALLRAVVLNADQSVKWLVDHGANVDAADGAGYTPLCNSVQYADPVAFDILVKAKADVHCHTKAGWGLMHLALRYPMFLPKVLAAGVPVDDPVLPLRETPLMVAAFTGNFSAAKWLLDHGANINAKDKDGRSIFEYAKMSNTLHTDRFFRQALGDLTKYGLK